MNRVAKIIILLAVLIFVGIQAQRLNLPWVNEFEAGFQEMIAIHHLESGIAANRFLPVIAEINGEKFYHTAHPPMLHIIYALLYKLFGAKEWVSRSMSLMLLLASIFLLSQLLEKKTRLFFWLFALFLPICFRLGITTNYEMLSIFSISLLLFCFEKWKENKKTSGLLMLPAALALVVLSDWPAYLAVPALVMVNLRRAKERNLLILLLAAELVFLALFIFYAKSVAGEVALFAHGQTRSNPLYIFQLSSYRELFQHLSWILGTPALILITLSLIDLFFDWKKPELSTLYRFWAWFLVLLWLTAANLTTRHFVYLLYFFPLAALALTNATSSLNHKKLATALILVSFLTPDYAGYQTRDGRGYYLARKFAERSGLKTCFSSAALGTLLFYDKIETVVPVSKRSTEALGKIDFDAIILDRGSFEVRDLIPLLKESRYDLAWTFPDMLVYLKKDAAFSIKYLATMIPEQESGDRWWDPKTEVIGSNRLYFYGLKQPPGPEKISSLTFKAEQPCLMFWTAVYHAPRSGKSDGVNFMVTGRSQENTRLLYARFLKQGAGAETQIDVRSQNNIEFRTDAGPKGDFSYDDAYWMEAKLVPFCIKRKGALFNDR
jgi:hypothetical protein